MPNISKYTEIYDITSKTQAIIAKDKVISITKFKTCPYAWFGTLKDKIESGKILWIAWNKVGTI